MGTITVSRDEQVTHTWEFYDATHRQRYLEVAYAQLY
jgi:hypothetical protein